MTTFHAAPTSARRLAVTVAAGAMALGLAACGSPSVTTTTAAGGGAAPAALTTTATPTPSTAAVSGETVDVKALGTAMAKAAAAKKYVHVTGTAGGQPVTGTVAYVDDTIRSHVKARGSEAITIGKTVYVKTNGKWKKQTARRSAPMGMGTGAPNIAAFATALGKTVRNLGTATLDGKSVTHYRSTATLAEVRSEVKTADARNLLDMVAKMGITGYTTDLYVGAGDLPAEVTLKVDGAPAGFADSTLTYSDWGTPVTIKAPKTS